MKKRYLQIILEHRAGIQNMNTQVNNKKTNNPIQIDKIFKTITALKEVHASNVRVKDVQNHLPLENCKFKLRRDTATYLLGKLSFCKMEYQFTKASEEMEQPEFLYISYGKQNGTAPLEKSKVYMKVNIHLLNYYQHSYFQEMEKYSQIKTHPQHIHPDMAQWKALYS